MGWGQKEAQFPHLNDIERGSEGYAPQHFQIASRLEDAEGLAHRQCCRADLVVMTTILLGSAPWSPLPLTVEVTA